MLGNVKMLLGIADDDTSKDKLINYYINSISTKILNYTHRTELPKELEHIVEEITVDKIKNSENGNKVKSIARGDTTITYADQNYNKLTGAGGADSINNYSNELDRFIVKKVRML